MQQTHDHPVEEMSVLKQHRKEKIMVVNNVYLYGPTTLGSRETSFEKVTL